MFSAIQDGLLIIVALIAGAALSWFRGRAAAKKDRKVKEQADYINTRERIDNAGTDTDSLGRDDLDRRLRDHTKR